MADVDVFAVRFRDSVRFNLKENTVLFKEQDHCTISRVQGGVRIASQRPGQRPIVVPDSNVKWMEMVDGMPAIKAAG